MSAADSVTWHSALQPDARPQDIAGVREAFLLQRQALGFAALGECERIERSVTRTPVVGDLLATMEPGSEASLAIFDDPVFAIWLRFLHRAAANGRKEEVVRHCANLPSVLSRVAKRVSGADKQYVPGTPISLQQDDLDTYVMAATPPSYDFTKVLQSPEARNGHGHPLPLQSDLLGTALQGIGRAWPALKEQIVDVVKIIGYLPDATFRSCSAARYSGIVYLGNMDESILDIEESLVHEAGHQVLYRLAEVTPLTQPGTPVEATYELPWSGSRRDLFGFLHAFYIYALLAKYFWRRAALEDACARDCVKRCLLIMLGLRLAAPTLRADANLSGQGRLIVDLLCAEIDALQEDVAAREGSRAGGSLGQKSR